MKVSWDYYSQYMEKDSNAPNHRPGKGWCEEFEIPEDTWGYLKIYVNTSWWYVVVDTSNVRSSPFSPVWSKPWAFNIWKLYQECNSFQRVLWSLERWGMHTNLCDMFMMIGFPWTQIKQITQSIYLSICLL
jgi:hypothetical protein